MGNLLLVKESSSVTREIYIVANNRVKIKAYHYIYPQTLTGYLLLTKLTNIQQEIETIL